jgi:hypothetical protein
LRCASSECLLTKSSQWATPRTNSFLRLAECPVAIANAVGLTKDIAAFVTRSEASSGVVELIDQLMANALDHVDAQLAGRYVALGTLLDDFRSQRRTKTCAAYVEPSKKRRFA